MGMTVSKAFPRKGDRESNDASSKTNNATHSKLALCSILTTFDMIANLSGGTCNHILNASIMFARISFPGLDVIYVNGSSTVYINR